MSIAAQSVKHSLATTRNTDQHRAHHPPAATLMIQQLWTNSDMCHILFIWAQLISLYVLHPYWLTTMIHIVVFPILHKY